ncbi:MAG: hypothetical protein QOJ00_654 [Actinomycetota bacterium]
MRVGVCILPEDRWTLAAQKWRGAEELGFDHAWTYDHLNWRDLRDSPWFAAVPTLTAAAQVTSRIRLGTLVASPNFRHPVSFAREVVTLDDISDGRLTLGVGAGGTGWDATILGQEPLTPRARADRFAEFVTHLDTLLRDQKANLRGEFFTADEARTYPGCVQRPRVPFAVAATGPRGMRLAARFAQTWVTTGEADFDRALGADEGAALVRKQMDRLDAACVDEGRDPATLNRLALMDFHLSPCFDDFAAARDAYAAVGVTDLVVHWPRASEPFAGDPDVLRGLSEQAQR